LGFLEAVPAHRDGADKERAVLTGISSEEAGSDASKRISRKVEQKIGPQQYKVWFKNSTQLIYADGFIKVGVPNLFVGGWLEDHFTDEISQAAKEVLEQDVQVRFAIDPVLFRKMGKDQLNSQAAFVETNPQRVLRDGRTRPAIAPSSPRRLRNKLDEFVVGSGNRLAYSVACNLVDDPHRDKGPVFFHSGCGLGKTHLLQGIGNALTDNRSSARWIYVSGEEFTNQFLLALREKTLDAFRHKFREIDVLLIDDVQFIANKRATQDEFLHTFNAIDVGGKRVVLASDAHPKMIGDLSESLVNRLMSGMIVRIDKPDFETRCEILRRKARQTPHTIPEAVIHYIAEKISANIRELEGCLLKLLAFASLVQKPITPEMARQALEEHLTQTGKILTVSDIERSVTTFFGLTPADLHTSRKSKTIALARNLAMYLARRHTDLSFPEIARLMGNKNHTTVLLAARRIEKLQKEDSDVSWQAAAGPQIRRIRELIQSQEEQLLR
jgi:chromosomal replication initiator protein